MEHADIAGQYEKMKIKLWREYEHNRDAYTEAKTEFVRKWTSQAKEVYRGRYCFIPASTKVFQIHWRSRAYTGDNAGKS